MFYHDHQIVFPAWLGTVCAGSANEGLRWRALTAVSFDYFGRSVVVEAPPDILADICSFFSIPPKFASSGDATFVLKGSSLTGWQLTGECLPHPLDAKSRAEVIINLVHALGQSLHGNPDCYLRASAVGWESASVLFLGADEKFCALASAWCIGEGFSYLSGGIVKMSDDGRFVTGFASPLILAGDVSADISALPGFRELRSVSGVNGVVAMPKAEWLAAHDRASAEVFVKPVFTEGAALSIEILEVEDARQLLAEAMLPGSSSKNAADAIVLATERAPFVKVTCGSLSQLNGVLDTMLRYVCENEAGRDRILKLRSALIPQDLLGAGSGAHKAATEIPQQKVYEVQAKTGPRKAAKLTIGMATYDDYDGVYFSIQALRMYHADVMNDVELLVIDNHPDGPSGSLLKQLDSKAANLRYIPVKDRLGTSVKNVVFEEASGEYVLCMDCHVFLVPGSLKRLLNYFDANPLTRDLLQGPLVPDELDTRITHWEPKWRGGMFGIWAPAVRLADLGDAPIDIPLMGMGAFACRKDAWPGFNPRFRGFGAEEGYVHEKFRQAGGRTLCLPFLGWMHRFNRPGGVPYRNRWEDRICNYMIGWQELGLPVGEMLDHMREIVGPQCVENALAELRAEQNVSGKSDGQRFSSSAFSKSTVK